MRSDEPASCVDCHEAFANGLELEQHNAMVHDAKWHGARNQSQNGDEGADGSVSPKTSDTLATNGGIDRPTTEHRAAVRQGRI